jgi:hypothetical protein
MFVTHCEFAGVTSPKQILRRFDCKCIHEYWRCIKFMLIYFPSFITILKASLMVTRNCVILIQNSYDVTKWILSKVVVISALDIITESHKLNSAFSELIFMELTVNQRTFSLSCPLSKSDEECRNCDQNFTASSSFQHIVIPGTDKCCTHRVEIFCTELYLKRWENTEMAEEIPSRHFASYGCQ